MIFFAPILSLVAIFVGGIATLVAAVLNGPRMLMRRREVPIVLLPPVPTPEMERLIEEAERDHALAL